MVSRVKAVAAYSRPQDGSTVLHIGGRLRLEPTLDWAGKCDRYSRVPSNSDRLLVFTVGTSPCAVGTDMGTINYTCVVLWSRAGPARVP